LTAFTRSPTRRSPCHPTGGGWPSPFRTGRTGRRITRCARSAGGSCFSLQGTHATQVAEAATGRNTQGVAFTPDGKYVVVQNYVEQELAMYRVTPTALEDTGVRIKVKGHPASLRVASQ
jgi:hypothetical protein